MFAYHLPLDTHAEFGNNAQLVQRLRPDAELSGEISEQQVHLARASRVAFIAADHHATEKFGAQAMGEHLATRFGVAHRFIDIPNPV